MLKRLREAVKQSRYQRQFVPPGHFYSPVPSFAEISRDERQIFRTPPREIAGIDMNEANQLALLQEFIGHYPDLPFTETKDDRLRYFYENPAYSYSDAISLFGMIRHARPKRIIEIGSGYSSCAMLDTNELFFRNQIEMTFIEPYPALLNSLMRRDDIERVEVIGTRVQDVALDTFARLEANDILFVDSTHVSKLNSDVNRIVFEILPLLARGVYIHFHDIFYPFEYPRVWILEGRAWNEAYLLRSFLQFNMSYRVVFMNTYLELFHQEIFRECLPLCLRNPGGSIWLQRQI